MGTLNESCTYTPLPSIPKESQGLLKTDVLIIGTGPIGATFARKILDETDSKVLMIDIGAFGSALPGEHLKNTSVFQKDVDPFANIIRGHWHNLSTPVNKAPTPTLGPGAFRIPEDMKGNYVLKNQNPKQKDDDNMAAAGCTYMVGGMGTHWTAACPRMNDSIEIPTSLSIPLTEWHDLYDEAEKLFHVDTHVFDHSIRHNLVKKVLQETYEQEIPTKKFQPQSLPLAARRRDENSGFVEWSSSATILGPHVKDPKVVYRASEPSLGCNLKSHRFRIMEQHICRKLNLSSDKSRIESALVENLLHKTLFKIEAKLVIVCCGTVLSAQLLYASEIRPESLGRYLTEQPMAFCQIVLNQDVVNRLTEPGSIFADEVKRYQEKNPKDPIPIPVNDPDPQCYIPVSENRPWHCQIHRDAFSYGDVAPNVDPRLIVDLRWFGIVEQSKNNRVSFDDTDKDFLGMPQPTFHYTIDNADRITLSKMMQDMLRAATSLGSFLPGSSPQFMTSGLSAHVNGVTRMGTKKEDSVIDVNCRVWSLENCYIGGLGVLPKAAACNQTLTCAAIAIHTVNHMLKANILSRKRAKVDISKQLTYYPTYNKVSLETHRKDGYWIGSADLNNNGYKDIIGYGLNVGDICWFENPNASRQLIPNGQLVNSTTKNKVNGESKEKVNGTNGTKEKTDNSKDDIDEVDCKETWRKRLIAKLNQPVGMDTADISGNGYQDIIICSEYGPNMKEINMNGGEIHWLENPGKNVNETSETWKKHFVGKVPGMHRLVVGNFTQLKRLQILALPVVGKAQDVHSTCQVTLYTSPPLDKLTTEKWEETIIDNEYFHVIHGVEKKKYRRDCCGDELDSVLLASQEGITFLYYDLKSKEFKKKRLAEGTLIEKRRSGFWGSGNVASGRIGDDPFAYIATIGPFHGNVVAVYIRDPEVGETGNLLTCQYRRHMLDIYGEPNENGEGPGHYCITKDLDDDGNDEFLIALRGDPPNQGVFYYKALDIHKGLFTKYHVSKDSAARIAVEDFNNDGKLDFATIGYSVVGYYMAKDCQLNVYYNNLDRKVQSGSKIRLEVKKSTDTEVVATIPFQNATSIQKSYFLREFLIHIHKHVISLAYLPPRNSLKIKKGLMVKVLDGSIYYKIDKFTPTQRIANVYIPDRTRSMKVMSEENEIWTQDEHAVFLWIEPEAQYIHGDIPKIRSVDSVHVNAASVGGCNVPFAFKEYNPKAKKEDIFYNMTGFTVQMEKLVPAKDAPELSKICHIQFWLADKKVDCGIHNHSESKGDDAFCEIHACFVNGTGSGGMYKYEGDINTPFSEMKEKDFLFIAVPNGYEHGPLWEISAGGKPKLREDGSVVYQGHRWRAGKGDKDDEDKSSYDLWMACELNPKISNIPDVDKRCSY